jgi:hypothetical protein
MTSYNREASGLLQKLAATDLVRLENLHIRASRLHSWLKQKQGAHLARLSGDTSCFADLAVATVHLLQLVSRY